mgnify:CR=1 FL=1
MKKKVLEKIVEFVNFSLKVDSNSTSTTVFYQPTVPKQLKQFKKYDK